MCVCVFVSSYVTKNPHFTGRRREAFSDKEVRGGARPESCKNNQAALQAVDRKTIVRTMPHRTRNFMKVRKKIVSI